MIFVESFEETLAKWRDTADFYDAEMLDVLPCSSCTIYRQALRIYAIVIDSCFDAQDIHVKTTAIATY